MAGAVPGETGLPQKPTKRPAVTTVVADDYEPARALLIDAMRSIAAFEVVAQAADGLEALAAVERHRPDLVLLDLAMPVAGGLDVIERINRESPATRVVIVSGFPGRDLEERVSAHGAAGYVRKRGSIRAVVDDIVAAAGLLDVAEQVLAETRRFGRDLGAAREARRFVAQVLDRWECRPALETIHLLLTEVVANAVLHADSAPEVSVRLLEDCVRIEVGDDSDTSPELRPLSPVDRSAPELLATSGRGMHIVASQAMRWGSALRPGGGKVIWFDVPRLSGTA